MEEILYFINGKEILFWNYTFLARKKKNACYAIVLYPWTGCFKLSAAWWIPSLLSGVAINSVNVGVRLSRQRQVIWQPVGGLKKNSLCWLKEKGSNSYLKRGRQTLSEGVFCPCICVCGKQNNTATAFHFMIVNIWVLDFSWLVVDRLISVACSQALTACCVWTRGRVINWFGRLDRFQTIVFAELLHWGYAEAIIIILLKICKSSYTPSPC